MQPITNIQTLLDPAQEYELIRAINENYIFITPNNRLSISLKQILNSILSNDNKKDKKNQIWESPKIYPYNDFIFKYWHLALSYNLSPSSELVSDTHALIIWEDIIRESDISNEIQSVRNLAKEAQRNYNELVESMINHHNHKFEFKSQIDSNYFFDFIDFYKRSIKKKKIITNVDAQKLLFDIDDFKLKNKFIIVGFNNPSPLQYSLLNKLTLDKNIIEINLKNKCSDISYSEFENQYDEIYSSARWAKHLYKEYKNSRIAVVFQDLNNSKIKIERIFSEVFSDDGYSKNMFEISVGTSLDKTSLVSDAILILKTLCHPLNINEWIKLFKSPYIQNNSKLIFFRPDLIDSLFSENINNFYLSDILKISKKNEIKYENEEFESVIYTALNFKHKIKKNSYMSPSEWANIFDDYLKIFSWPFIGNLKSNEYQQYIKFKSSIDSFRGYNSILTSVNLNKANTLFLYHLSSQVFHSETIYDDHQPIQILGGLEASGQIFDFCWFAGMSEKKWPRNVKKNTLIPILLQIDNSIISSNYELHLEYAKKITHNYISSSKNIIISFSKSKDDPAPKFSKIIDDCIQNLKLKSLPDKFKFTSDINYTKKIPLGNPFEYFPELCGSPCNKSIMGSSLKGGSSLIKDHNINPLRAYVRWRLGIQPQILKTEIISNLDRGRIVHKTLEIIWSELGTSAALKRKNISNILDLISTSLDKAFDQTFSRHIFQPKKIYIAAEKKMLQIAILSLLRIESKRPSFSVERLEFRSSYKYKGFSINLQIDRIDKLGVNEYLLIDYKLGFLSKKGWTDDYLTDPQLPLYLLVFNDNYQNSYANSLSYCFVRLNEKQGFSGLKNISSATENIDGIKNYDEKLWSDQISEWKISLDNSIEQILNGKIHINLKKIISIDQDLKSRFNKYNKNYDSFFRFSYSKLISEDDLKENFLNLAE